MSDFWVEVAKLAIFKIYLLGQATELKMDYECIATTV